MKTTIKWKREKTSFKKHTNERERKEMAETTDNERDDNYKKIESDNEMK